MPQITLTEEAVSAIDCTQHPQAMEGYRCYRIEYGYECSCPEGRIWLPRTMTADLIEKIVNALIDEAEAEEAL